MPKNLVVEFQSKKQQYLEVPREHPLGCLRVGKPTRPSQTNASMLKCWHKIY